MDKIDLINIYAHGLEGVEAAIDHELERVAELEVEVEREKAIASRLSGECAKWEKRDDHMAAEVERLREALLGLLPSFAAEEWDADCGCPQCNAYQVAVNELAPMGDIND